MKTQPKPVGKLLLFSALPSPGQSYLLHDYICHQYINYIWHNILTDKWLGNLPSALAQKTSLSCNLERIERIPDSTNPTGPDSLLQSQTCLSMRLLLNNCSINLPPGTHSAATICQRDWDPSRTCRLPTTERRGGLNLQEIKINTWYLMVLLWEVTLQGIHLWGSTFPLSLILPHPKGHRLKIFSLIASSCS